MTVGGLRAGVYLLTSIDINEAVKATPIIGSVLLEDYRCSPNLLCHSVSLKWTSDDMRRYQWKRCGSSDDIWVEITEFCRMNTKLLTVY